mmetsp:Transcript_24723/g.41806  ORF Transcript_24723/g.41806 Transcript_24723/m.41806 type:complete len:362 (+) Transcript_24723:66-1151(+)|eukprot:CAMPEP_0114431540 /NCGR_PEP_ID=MMETSP0103-20121206/10661_1 /TAXON_ID=37642 ORGANISM="Paraphysomonas imperforata, Strain PA2" /NCGR_SAMPLE_ID=MMETSP0103 /ASSEMBLY_ACC=CAM_ASM_000201 /LENGTH=361 /DNA_ID=CAMNT_0001601125 /DNA_START=46 /DNA_END=1131 /DNA_ORIENTATION=+
MFKQMNLKKSLISLSQFSLGDYPGPTELEVIQSLGLTLSKPFIEAEDQHLLVTLHSLITRQFVSNSVPPEYSRIGDWWKWSLGFQHSDPVSDIRGGGILSLHNLIYFLSNHPIKATSMIKSRQGRSLTADHTYPSFPWACAGINLTRILALEFEIVLPTGFVNTCQNAQHTKKTTWSYLLEENGFNRMYVCLFLLLDCLWDEMGATYMDFNNVLKAVSEEFSLHLALSSSLVNLENRVHQRINFIDPDVRDYSMLPEAHESVTPPALTRSLSSFFDMEGQEDSTTSNSNQTSEMTEEAPLYSFIASHMPSYDQVVTTLLPLLDEPEPESSATSSSQYQQPPYEFEHFQHQNHTVPYNLQIV